MVRKLKRYYPKEKIGHAGTLDPLATGLLIVAIGKQTKQLGNFLHMDKTYQTTVNFSIESDTRDTDYWKDYKEYAHTEN